MWNVLHVPVVGVPPRQYSLTRWDGLAVRALIEQYGIEYALFLPDYIDVDDPSWSHHPFLTGLKNGQFPSWLEPVYVDSEIQVFRVQRK